MGRSFYDALGLIHTQAHVHAPLCIHVPWPQNRDALHAWVLPTRKNGPICVYLIKAVLF